MHWNNPTPWLALLLLSSTASAQVKSQPGSLERARRTFVAVDADGDQALGFSELEKAGLSRKSFIRFDADRGDTWSEADFLLYYSHLIKSSGKRIDAAFELELARIRARRDPSRKEKAELAKPLPEKAVTKQREVVKSVAPRRNGQPAPPVVIDPAAVPRPKDGSIPTDPEREAYEKAARERELANQPNSDLENKNLVERAKEAQRRKQELSKPKGSSKRTQG